MDLRRLATPTPEDRSLGLDIVRAFLGIGLLVRGAVFAVQPDAFYGLLDTQDPAFSAMVFAHYVSLAHLAGGLFLALGLLTRIAAAVQVPILAGAVFWVHLGEGLAAPGQGLEFAALVLVLLIVFTVFGSGRLSLDHYLFVVRNADAEQDEQDAIADTRLEELREREIATASDWDAVAGIQPGERPCVHGRSRAHPRVGVERDYGFGRSMRFITGTTSMPKRVLFLCQDCGGIAEVSTNPEDLNYYRYNEEKRREAPSSSRGPGVTS